MQRRDLLAAMATIPLTAVSLKDGRQVYAAELKPERFLMFIDTSRIDLESLALPKEWESSDVVAIPVKPNGRPVEEAIAIYRMEEDDDQRS